MLFADTRGLSARRGAQALQRFASHFAPHRVLASRYVQVSGIITLHLC